MAALASRAACYLCNLNARVAAQDARLAALDARLAAQAHLEARMDSAEHQIRGQFYRSRVHEDRIQRALDTLDNLDSAWNIGDWRDGAGGPLRDLS